MANSYLKIVLYSYKSKKKLRIAALGAPNLEDVFVGGVRNLTKIDKNNSYQSLLNVYIV